MSFSLTVLGSSSALPTASRFLTAHVLNVSEHFYLVDCGEGTQIQLRKCKIPFGKINNIFISHLHGDHYYGLFGLLSSFNLMGRTSELNIYSHSDLENILEIFFSREKNELKYSLKFHSLNYQHSKLIFEDKHIEIYSFPLKHRIPVCGFLFREKQKPLNIRKEIISQFHLSIKDILKIKNGENFISQTGEEIENKYLTFPKQKIRSYAFCSDTIYLENLAEVVKNVDLLYHEATFRSALQEEAKNTFHSTSTQAAMVAQAADAKKLLIGHFSSRYKNVDELLAEAKVVFPETYAVNDGETYSVPEERED